MVWFGYADNQHCIDKYYPLLKRLNLELTVISERDIGRADKFIKWEVDTFKQHINDCDFALLPKNGRYKTNNKDITTWLCGLPVAKSKRDVRDFVSKDKRLEHLAKVDFYKFNIIDRAWNYNDLCVQYLATKQKGITED